MNFVKENWFKLTIILVLLILLFGAYYFKQYKPTKIKSACSAEARFDRRALSEPNDIKRQEFINRYYDDCLMRFGLR